MRNAYKMMMLDMHAVSARKMWSIFTWPLI